MKRAVRIVHVESAGWALDMWRIGDYLRAELESPDGTVPWTKPLASSVDGDDDGIFPSVRSFFAVRALDHVGAALITQARAELKASGEVA